MSTDQLRTLLAVAELGSLSRAAAVRKLGQSTVSFQLKALEESVGARLLDRTGRGVRPTATGRLLLRYARRLIALEEEALTRVRAEETGVTGRVNIAASTIPAEYLLPARLARFRAEHPESSVRVTVSDSRGAEAALLAESCDLAVVGAPVRDRRVASVRLAEDEVVLAGPTRGPYASASVRRRADLASLPLVLREAGSGTQQAVERLLPSGALDPEGPGRVELGSSEAARRAVLHGLGFAFLSRTAIADDVAAGTLRVVPFPGTPVRRTFWVARLRTITPSATVRAFLALLEREAPRRGSR
jgi:DNA-binding transcriptional LysR family regulator